MLVVTVANFPGRLTVQGRDIEAIVVDEPHSSLLVHQNIPVLEITVGHLRSPQPGYDPAPLCGELVQGSWFAKVFAYILLERSSWRPLHTHDRIPPTPYHDALVDVPKIDKRGE